MPSGTPMTLARAQRAARGRGRAGSTAPSARRSAMTNATNSTTLATRAPDDHRRPPRVVAAAHLEREHEQHRSSRAACTCPSQSMRWRCRSLSGSTITTCTSDDGGDADGQVHVEHPPPRQLVGEEATDQRPDDRREPEHRRHHRRELRPRCSSVYRSATIVCATGSRHPAPTPCMARNRMSCTIDVDSAAERRADEEDDHAEQEDALAAVHVGESAPQRDRRDLARADRR